MLSGVPTLMQAPVQVQVDAVKGRYVTAAKPYAAGEIVFQDQAFVFATCNGEDLLELKLRKPTFDQLVDSAHESANEFHPSQHKLFCSLLSVMRGIEIIGEVDRAKCILKCVTKLLQTPSALNDMLTLSYANEPACVQVAQQLTQKFPAVFTQVTVPVLAKIIGVLNTNSHELEALGNFFLRKLIQIFMWRIRGHGVVFVGVLDGAQLFCKLQVCFTTDGDTLWVTAIRPIEPNEPMSIDYGNMFYRPRQERQEHMLRGYGFTCVCHACTEFSDKTRVYQCRLNGCRGLVHPFPTKPMETYRCMTCQQAWSPAQVQAIVGMEQELEANLPTTYHDILRIEANTPFHRYHYLLFWALDNLGLKGAQGLEHDVNTLAAMWSDLISGMEYVMPDAHHEKTIYYDQLAQIQVITGDIPGAVEAYETAYRISCVVSGATTPPTLALKALMENPPRNRHDLIARYGSDNMME
ncbi:Aste57867_10841 [Aphanomyces stellatus]|uniref:Aste57867_10841 protein n=1 Tax=Aphanomyces stellatus TaxID=120398 RepID=A0A485KRI9_9STRA|nr:hypothetical protein As57867_010801 [Aphanomyces stellatus]VFT87709.1 Aste57867_10841 [Aphanomyces stellatus]